MQIAELWKRPAAACDRLLQDEAIPQWNEVARFAPDFPAATAITRTDCTRVSAAVRAPGPV